MPAILDLPRRQGVHGPIYSIEKLDRSRHTGTTGSISGSSGINASSTIAKKGVWLACFLQVGTLTCKDNISLNDEDYQVQEARREV